MTIGEGITSIGQDAFRGCTSVTEYTFLGSEPPTLNAKGSLYGSASGFTIYVPSSAVDTYKAAEGWSGYEILPIE